MTRVVLCTYFGWTLSDSAGASGPAWFACIERLVHNLPQWDHFGFSVVGSARTREALDQYIARPPVSLNNLLVEHHAAMRYQSHETSPYTQPRFE